MGLMISTRLRPIALAAALAFALPQAQAASFNLTEASIPQLEDAMAKGTLSSEKLVKLYLKRIEAYDKKGPAINAVITLNPKAVDEAKKLDAERKAGKVRGPLHGIPVLLKDNIDVAGMVNSAGSLALADNKPAADAFVAARLRAAPPHSLTRAGGGGRRGVWLGTKALRGASARAASPRPAPSGPSPSSGGRSPPNRPAQTSSRQSPATIPDARGCCVSPASSSEAAPRRAST